MIQYCWRVCSMRKILGIASAILSVVSFLVMYLFFPPAILPPEPYDSPTFHRYVGNDMGVALSLIFLVLLSLAVILLWPQLKASIKRISSKT